MNICKRTVSFWRRSCFSSCSGRCARLGSRKLLSVFLTVLLLFICAVPSFAAEFDSLEYFTIELQRSVTSGSSTITTNWDYTAVSYSGNASYYSISPIDKEYWASGGSKLMTTFRVGDLKAGHDYEVELSAGVSFNASYNVYALVDGVRVYETTFSGAGAKTISFSFSAPDVVTPYTTVSLRLQVGDNYDYGSGENQNAFYLLSKVVDITDRTDEPGWLGRILQKFTDLGDAIGNFFSSLGDRISGFFTDLWENIKQKFDDLKQWFVDLGDRIQGFFVELYNDIVEGLKSLFIPSDGYFDAKKTELETFAIEHFGALYQVPDLMVDTLRKFTSMSPEQPSITLPAIEFNFNGKHYVLSDSITYSFSWVNDSGNALFYLYKFYRGFVTVILFFAFANYCIKKYNEVFAGSDAE